MKGKGEKDIPIRIQFQRIARRDKKAYLSDQCKEIEENNRMGKTRDLFKKIEEDFDQEKIDQGLYFGGGGFPNHCRW